jgi:2-dehydropantoate 2-reductase
MSEPVIAVVGAGAVGGLIGTLLHRSGTEVVAVARPETARQINSDGLTLHSPHFGDQLGRLTAVTEIPVGARVIVATKAYALPGIVDALRRAQPAEVVSLLNGIEHMDVLRRAAPDARVAGATIAVESTRLSPTVIDHRSPFLRLTVPATAESTGVVTAWNRAGLDVTVGGTEAEVLWSKLRFLAPMALLTSYWRLPIGAAREHDPALTTAVLAEVAQIATRDGVPSDPAQLARAIHALPAGMRSSLQNDLDAGAETELDAIGGALLRRARHHGVPAPRVQELLDDLGSRGAAA